MLTERYPAVVIHGLADAQAVLSFGHPVTLLSGDGAAQYAGCGWWRALIAQARAQFDNIPVDDILDCADASGLALGALRLGQRHLVLTLGAPGWAAVASIAASLGGEIFTSRPPALDMADRGAAFRLGAWLQLRTAPDDNGPAVS